MTARQPGPVLQAPGGASGRQPGYTVRDTPEVRQRIDGELAHVIATVRAGDPGLRSLVLTGGFARGEGTVLDGKPQNDYDFVALRGLRRPRTPYAEMAHRLEGELGLHIDLAPVALPRLRLVDRSIFWYETALRGRVLWGDQLLGRIPVRTLEDIDPAEGVRLLVNRAAGLLLVTPNPDAHANRIQAAKGLLAALDAQLLAAGAFAPSQRERWTVLQLLREEGGEPAGLRQFRTWLAWAFAFKVDPASAPPVDAHDAWRAARRAILAAVPPALRHAGLPDLASYAREDGWLDRAIFFRRSSAVPGARRWARHPTARLRVATLRLLAESPDGRLEQATAATHLRPLARDVGDPVRMLDGLRRATLQ